MFVLDAILDEGADTLVDLLLHCRRLTTNSSSSWRRDRQWQWQWRSFFGLKPSPLIVLCFRVYVVTPIRSFPSFELFTSRISLFSIHMYVCTYRVHHLHKSKVSTSNLPGSVHSFSAHALLFAYHDKKHVDSVPAFLFFNNLRKWSETSCIIMLSQSGR